MDDDSMDAKQPMQKPLANLVGLAVSAIAITLILPIDLWAQDDAFSAVAGILERKCLNCHAGDKPKGALGLDVLSAIQKGGDSGPAIAPGNPDASLLIEYVVGPNPQMPKSGSPLSPQEIEVLRSWIAQGAKWPADRKLEDRHIPDSNWWSLKPLVRPTIPNVKSDSYLIYNAIDAFVVAKLIEKGLPQSSLADRRTLIRRLCFDLTGLPPTPEQVAEFLADPKSDIQAYSDLVDKLLDSPRYGERWARHWLDVVHFGETHGYDKDKLRPNAWPYRDYVIRAFNSDKPYHRFIEEQIAGDLLHPETVDGIEALGFISAGPWDFIGHAEVPETKIDGKVARHLDRDDMVATAMGTFNSLTVGCAQCHNHKFDPIPQKDYYRLQAVFAAVDRADRTYDRDPQVAIQRQNIELQIADVNKQLQQIDTQIIQLGGKPLEDLDQRIAESTNALNTQEAPEFGYHSQIAEKEDSAKWVQVDLGQSQVLESVELVACHDNFNNIGAGFGFPVRFVIQASDDPEFNTDVVVLWDQRAEDFANPGVVPVRTKPRSEKAPIKARYVRVTATKLVHRLPTDYIFALSELSVFSSEGKNVAARAPVISLDSIEAPPRWQKKNLTDGYYYGKATLANTDLALLRADREKMIDGILDLSSKQKRAELQKSALQLQKAKQELPPQQTVYSGVVHHGSGAFAGTGSNGGKPRPIFVLDRGNVTMPKEEVTPGGLACLEDLNTWFELPSEHTEAQRRGALAHWLSDKRNPLTWRSIVNRVWQYHFGNGIVLTANDLGRMGAEPTHPELLDWLAIEFRDSGQSLKQLHKWIVMSHTYRQVSSAPISSDGIGPEKLDADNRYLWRANRRRLEAEAIRDVVLQISGKLDLTMGGPSFQDFVIEHPEHSPHYEYHLYNPEDTQSHRRSVYRFLVRSQPQPFMTTLDCADPSMRVDKRNESLSPLQALALLNNGFVVTMSSHFAKRIEAESSDDVPSTGHKSQIHRMFQLAFGRDPIDSERIALEHYISEHGLANACRLIFNLNEFSFVD